MDAFINVSPGKTYKANIIGPDIQVIRPNKEEYWFSKWSTDKSGHESINNALSKSVQRDGFNFIKSDIVITY